MVVVVVVVISFGWVSYSSLNIFLKKITSFLTAATNRNRYYQKVRHLISQVHFLFSLRFVYISYHCTKRNSFLHAATADIHDGSTQRNPHLHYW